MASKDKRDYYALQQGWRELEHLYNHAFSKEEQVEIIDNYIDNLVDEGTGKMALFSLYLEWEKTNFKSFLLKKFKEWKYHNTFAAGDENIADSEMMYLRRDWNFLRYRQIRQIIQDSGIGFGDKSGVKQFTARGYDGD